MGRTPSNGRLTACERFLDGLDAEASLVVPSISILEVFKWVLRECSETWSWILIVDSRWPAASSLLPPEPVNHACTQCTAFFSTLTRQAKCRTLRSGRQHGYRAALVCNTTGSLLGEALLSLANCDFPIVIALQSDVTAGNKIPTTMTTQLALEP